MDKKKDPFEDIVTKEDFINFTLKLSVDFDQNREEWSNITISEFLESMAAYLESMDPEVIYERYGVVNQENLVHCKDFIDCLWRVKAPGLNDRKLPHMWLILGNLRSFNRGSSHAARNSQEKLYSVLAGVCFLGCCQQEKNMSELMGPRGRCKVTFTFP